MKWAGLWVLGLLVLAGCKTEIYTNVSEREANAMVALLLGDGVEADKQVGDGDKFTVRVEEAFFARSVRLLHAHGYPQREYASLATLFQDGGLIPTPFEERVLFMYGLSEELAHTISMFDGVVAARVHVAVPVEDANLQEDGKAAVYIKHEPSFDFDTLSPQIKRLVADAVDDVPYANVELLALPSYELAPLTGQSGAGTPEGWRHFAGVRVDAAGYGRLVVMMWIAAVLAGMGVLAVGVQVARGRKQSRG